MPMPTSSRGKLAERQVVLKPSEEAQDASSPSPLRKREEDADADATEFSGCVCLRRHGLCSCRDDSQWLRAKRGQMTKYTPPHARRAVLQPASAVPSGSAGSTENVVCRCLRRHGRCTCQADDRWLQRKRKTVEPYVPPHLKERQRELETKRQEIAQRAEEADPKGLAPNIRTLARQWEPQLEKGGFGFNPLQAERGAVGAPTLLQPSKSTEKVGDDPVAIQMPLHAPSLCKTPPFYRQDYRHISWLRRVYWALALTVAYGGIFWPWFGLVIMPIMLGLTVLGFFRGRKWCGNFCDRGALMDGPLRMLHQKFFALPLIRRSPDMVGQIPEVIKHPGLRVLVFAVLITFFVSRVVMACASCEDFEGPEFWKKIAMIGSRMWLISVSMVIGMGILFGPRAFCYVCPMGTMQIAVHWVHHVVLGKNSNKCEPMVTLVDPDACLKCGQCTRVCPMQLDVHNEFDEKGQLRNVDCIKCGSCVWYCAQQILEFRAPGFNEHPNPRDSMNAPAPAKQATLVDIEDLSRDCRKFKFRTVDGKGLAGGQAGQYALVQVDQKRNVFRGYTISSADPSVEPLEVTVKLDKRGYGTPRLFNLQPGAGVMLVPNLGEDFIPTPEKVKTHVLLLASGVGITPFRSIAYELLERRHHSGKVHLLYSVHGEEDVIYADEWQGLSETYPNFQATIMVRHQAEDAKFCVGNVWDKIPELQNPKDSCAFICGTTNMAKKSVAALEKAGMDRENIVIENFAKQHRRKVGIAYQRDAPVWLRCNPTYRAKVE